jgi:hypothetical protein
MASVSFYLKVYFPKYSGWKAVMLVKTCFKENYAGIPLSKICTK